MMELIIAGEMIVLKITLINIVIVIRVIANLIMAIS